MFREIFSHSMRGKPEFARAKLQKMQFLCIAKRVAVNEVNSSMTDSIAGRE